MDCRTPVEMGAMIAELRQKAGLDQQAVAAHLGVEAHAVSRIELGERRLSALELAALAELLRVEPGLIVSREAPAEVLLRTAGAAPPAVREALAAFEVVMTEVLAARALEELL